MKRKPDNFARIDFAGVGLCAALTAAVYFGCIAPLRGSQTRAQSLHAQLVEEQSKESSLAATSRMLRAQLASIDATLKQSAVKLQPAASINSRLAELNALASTSGLDVQIVRTDAIVQLPRYAKVPINITATGDYRACARFLHELSIKYPDTGVHHFDVAAVSVAASSTQASFAIQLIWYVSATSSVESQKGGGA